MMYFSIIDIIHRQLIFGKRYIYTYHPIHPLYTIFYKTRMNRENRVSLLFSKSVNSNVNINKCLYLLTVCRKKNKVEKLLNN